MSNTRLVFSTDPKENQKCPRCKELTSECKCAPLNMHVYFKSMCPVLRIEKNGRGGKTVTVIDKLPRNENYLKTLSSDLKKRCGTGGTFSYELGTVEIQGDKREQIRGYFTKQGIKFKG